MTAISLSTAAAPCDVTVPNALRSLGLADGERARLGFASPVSPYHKSPRFVAATYDLPPQIRLQMPPSIARKQPATGALFVVITPGAAMMHHLPAGPRHAVTEIDVLEVFGEPLVERADVDDGLA